MKSNPLLKLQSFGQSVWMDFIRRGTISSGELQQLIDEDGLRGVTSNPSIFEKAISGSHDYDQTIRTLALEGKSPDQMYQAVVVEDIQMAADLFRPVYNQTDRVDGYVSLEVNPHLAHDTAGTITEALRLWEAVERPNVMIKVPATAEGLPAIRELTFRGVNVNVTLLFGLPRYQQVAESYLAGLEDRRDNGLPLDLVNSVASFFLSRIDVLIDPMLDKIIQAGGENAEKAAHLKGQVAIASAKVAYRIYQNIFGDPRFQELAAQGARTQRLLWASTSTKNPEYSDTMYIEPLVGPNTINTMPLETLDAYRDHGNPALRLTRELGKAQEVLEQLAEVGLNLDQATQQLEEEGVEKFNKPFDLLMKTLQEKSRAALGEPVDRMSFNLAACRKVCQTRIKGLEGEQFGSRLWRKDASLWKAQKADQEVIRNSLGWLHAPEKMEETLSLLENFRDEIKSAGFTHVVLLGMGGSSLTPLLFQRTFPAGKKGLPLLVLDSTDPETIRNVEQEAPPDESFYLISSKSGTTAEVLAFCDYFYDKVKAAKGDKAGESFAAITDPGTPLARLARDRSFRCTFLNFADVGGRYSALTYFGLLPAALMGLDLSELLTRALRMKHACSSSVPAPENPGLILGAALGELARRGRDKVTFILPEPVAALGLWLEQLLAESTGKEGSGLLPVAGEPLADPAVYGEDRIFVHFVLKDYVDVNVDAALASLEQAGHPLITIQMDDSLDIAQEFFRWEVAVAAAGAVLRINPFDQPNVQESKDNTNRLLEQIRKSGRLPEETPTLSEGSLQVFSQEAGGSLVEILGAFLAASRPRDYIALNAYLPEVREVDRELEALRRQLLENLHTATTVGYGPRYLHSTGQYHKGGPNAGLFIELTMQPQDDLPIPGRPYTFGMLERAQALGDLEALRKHGRRTIRIDLGVDAAPALEALRQSLEQALAPELVEGV